MNALEFSGKIEQGLIRLPKQYEGYENSHVRVIVLVDEPDLASAKKERLRLVLQKMSAVNMFSKIDDPVDWQKKLRNEWE